MNPELSNIINKNKQKRKEYCSTSKSCDQLSPKLKYFKNLISRTLITIIFVLSSIIFTNYNTQNKDLYKKYVLESSLEFNKINNLYQSIFGQVDIIDKDKEETKMVFNSFDYTNIEDYKNGVKLTIGINNPVSVITSGIIVYIGEKDDLGNTIIIQGNDGADIWYSNITDSDIAIYDYIESGSILGTSNSDDIYITISKDGEFISYEEYKSNI